MSTESRLARLGLLHLKDKPEELQAALEKLGREIEEERKRLRECPSEAPPEQGQDEECK